MRRRLVVAGLVGCLMSAGCSSLLDEPTVPAPQADPDHADRGSPEGGEPSVAAVSPTPRPTITKTPRPKRKRSDKGTDRDRKPGRDGKSDGDAEERRTAVAAPDGPSSSRTDRTGDGDREGDPPDYPDIRRATMAGGDKALLLVIQVETRIPRRLGRGTNMTAHFRLDMPDGSEHRITAVGDSDGWRAEIDDGPFSGRFSISSDLFVFEVPWRVIGGRSFRWFANTAWTREAPGLDDDREYYFDRVPELEAATFPD